MRKTISVWAAALSTLWFGCVGTEPLSLEEEGAGFCAWSRQHDQPEVVTPEIIVSLAGLTLAVFDRETGVSRVYPVGVDANRGDGRSLTPVGRFTTGAAPGLPWFHTCRSDAKFGGYPFIRLARNGGFTHHGMHGPTTKTLRRGFVSHGRVRMRVLDVGEPYELLDGHFETPITIQTAVDLDAAGNPVDVGRELALWQPGEQASVDELDLAYADDFVDDPWAKYDEGGEPFGEYDVASNSNGDGDGDG